MLSTMSYKLNGVALDTENCLVIVGSTLMPGISTRRTVATVPGVSGTLNLGVPPVFEEREITLKVDAFTPKVYEESSRIMRLCSMPNLTLTRVKDGVEQSTRVELVSLTADDDSSHPNNLVSFTAKFAMTGIWWHEPEYWDRPLSLNKDGLVFPKPVTINKFWTRWSGEANNSTSLLADFITMWRGEANNSESLLFEGGIPGDGFWGDAPLTDIVFRFPSTVTSVSLTDPTSNTGISWTGAADNAKPLYIRPDIMRAWRSDYANSWTPTGTDVSTGLDYPAGGILQVWPDIYELYRLKVTATGATGDALMHVRRAWW